MRILAGIAKPSPKLGQSLGPLGVNMVKFCQQFNKQTSHIRADVPMKVRLTAYTDRSYTFIIKPPQTSWFLRKGSGIQKFTPTPGHIKEGEICIQYVYQIAKIKKELDRDLKNVQIPHIMNMIIGQLGTCGLGLTQQAFKPDPIPIKTKTC